jgi:hypothetical protein
MIPRLCLSFFHIFFFDITYFDYLLLPYYLTLPTLYSFLLFLYFYEMDTMC